METEAALEKNLPCVCCWLKLAQSSSVNQRVMLSDALFSIGQETKADFVGQRPGFKL